jgi:hypothetical protein
VALSHDVDAFDITRPEVCGFEKIDRGESERGVRSSFYFCMTSGRGYHPEEGYWDPSYTEGNPGFSQTLPDLRKRGFEVGLHGSYDSGSYRNPAALVREKERLERIVKGPVFGGRQHYLRFIAPQTWAAYEQAGMLYDSTLGYHDRIGFRAGMAAPFRPFDPRRGAPFDLWELPLMVMDGALFDMEPDLDTQERKWQAVEEMLAHLADCGGCSAILWHQRVFSHPAHAGWGEIYWRILDWVKARGGYMGPAREIIEDWRAGSALRLVCTVHRPGARQWQFRSLRALDHVTLEIIAPEETTVHVSSTLSPERFSRQDEWLHLNRLRQGEQFTLTAEFVGWRESEAAGTP